LKQVDSFIGKLILWNIHIRDTREYMHNWRAYCD